MCNRTGRILLSLALIGSLAAAAGCGKAPEQPAEPLVQATGQAPPPAAANAVRIARDPADLPAPISRRQPEKVMVSLETREVRGTLTDGTTFTYWTFDGTVPGPMVRVRVGDTVELRLKNQAESKNVHSIDLHAVTGPGGGAVLTQVRPGEEKVFTFKALNPGVYVYHCATPHIPSHIAMGMYGLIVVEPEEGLPPVDREFYVMQGEVYTAGERGARGDLAFDGNKLFHEDPDFVVFNGQFAALTGDHAMKARVGDTVRIFVGNGGPNLASSFHVIGEIFDRVHPEGASEAQTNVQTTLVPAGGAAWVEFKVEVPGTYTLVDHSISRAIDKGAMAQIEVDGDPNDAVYHGGVAANAGH